MAKMTSDLYFTQLSEINSFSVADKRTDVILENLPDQEGFSLTALSFFITINKDKTSDKWTTTYHVVNKAQNDEHLKTNHYDSFYKILMEPKSLLQETLKNLIENGSDSDNVTANAQKEPSFKDNSNKSKINSTETLSGTWKGEENINKIIILRGGRGFVIFKNGASMNVTVAISDSDSSVVTVTQNGKANASFYPELARNVALSAAISAEPIKWTLTSKDETTLSGIKSTLIPDGDSFTVGNINVEWKKIN